ncbi:hypothetical protein [Pseudomonas fluorescens]|uniref:hypothetical protein n=1 Tax=Pseudomonas fluorescens TaxID=294 RepID=UPI001CD37C7B|nr:hypothetical protein [Pseudomonas fluorescens]
MILLVRCFAGMRGELVPQVYENQDKLHLWVGFFCLTVSAFLACPPDSADLVVGLATGGFDADRAAAEFAATAHCFPG